MFGVASINLTYVEYMYTKLDMSEPFMYLLDAVFTPKTSQIHAW